MTGTIPTHPEPDNQQDHPPSSTPMPGEAPPEQLCKTRRTKTRRRIPATGAQPPRPSFTPRQRLLILDT